MKKNLKWFLIQRFLIILFGSSLSEELLNTFYRLVLLPGLIHFLESQQIEIVGNGNIVVYLLYLLFSFLAGFLPSGVGEWVQRRLSIGMEGSLEIRVSSPLYSGVWGVALRLGLICILLFLLILSLIPYVLGAFCYYRIVSGKIKELLEEEKEQQLAFDRKRNLLLSDIAHDIKTPITAICGYSRALAEGVAEEEKRQEYLDVIYAKSMRIDALISLLFEYVKLESEGYELHRERGDLAELLREMTALLYTEFEERQMSLVLEIPDEEVFLEMDSVQMGRAITNLLTNAVRYGKEGGRVLVRLFGYEITVADEGESVEPAFAEHIFDPFTRADAARSSQGGSGLGLGISHKRVEMHG
ncbi:MAG: HAMP domain-containing histidine kinase, partial [Lachnospiraceae bacterium]|nr:HAMP domain-containing histidine kinase [Lachnospiraceae bacterium]